MGRRQGARRARILMRYVTDEQRSRLPILIATLWAAASWLFFRVARSLRIDSRYARRSCLEKQPTDLRRNICLFRGQDTRSRPARSWIPSYPNRSTYPSPQEFPGFVRQTQNLESIFHPGRSPEQGRAPQIPSCQNNPIRRPRNQSQRKLNIAELAIRSRWW